MPREHPLVRTTACTMVDMQGDYSFQLSRRCYALQGMACVVTAAIGLTCIVCVDLAELHKFGTLSEAATIIGDHDELIENAPEIGVSRGQSVFFPYGWLPLICTTDNSAEQKSRLYIDGWSGFLIHYLIIQPPAIFPKAHSLLFSIRCSNLSPCIYKVKTKCFIIKCFDLLLASVAQQLYS